MAAGLGIVGLGLDRDTGTRVPGGRAAVVDPVVGVVIDRVVALGACLRGPEVRAAVVDLSLDVMFVVFG
jgi:hypothetical protein